MIRIAMVSSWHVHANGYARELGEIPGCQITAVWDELPERGKKWADQLGCRFIENYDELLADGEIDAVAVCAPTNIHSQIILKAARAGKHIFTEKVLTLSSADAEEIRSAVKENNIHFTISFVHQCRDSLQFAKKAVDSGMLGEVTYARVRNCHSGSVDNWLPPHFYDREQCGGGAMVDLGAHPMYLLNWLLGEPQSVRSLFTNVTDRPVEDNAVCLIDFGCGKIGVSETGFVSRCDHYTVDISGTKGAISIADDNTSYCTVDDTERKWIPAPVESLHLQSPLKYWIDSIKNDTPNTMFGIDEAVALTKLMEAAYKSHESGIAESIG